MAYFKHTDESDVIWLTITSLECIQSTAVTQTDSEPVETAQHFLFLMQSGHHEARYFCLMP